MPSKDEDPLELSAVNEIAIPIPSPETQEVAERVDAEATDLDYQSKLEGVRQLRFDNKQRRQDRKERRRYAHRIFCLISIWLSAVLLILVFQGFGWWGFKLADSIVITAIGTTTATVLGIFLIVANYLFPKKS
jgi:hypothetical protein